MSIYRQEYYQFHIFLLDRQARSGTRRGSWRTTSWTPNSTTYSGATTRISTKTTAQVVRCITQETSEKRSDTVGWKKSSIGYKRIVLFSTYPIHNVRTRGQKTDGSAVNRACVASPSTNIPLKSFLCMIFISCGTNCDCTKSTFSYDTNLFLH